MSQATVFIQNLHQQIASGKKISSRDFFKLKNEFSSEHKVSNVRNIDLIEAYRELVLEGKIEKNISLERIISIRSIRSESGVSVITCLTKPFACPGKCIYCPTEKDMPKSYLSNQPAAMRGVLNKFDAFSQVQNRLSSLMATGHDTSKIELIVIGGTWSYLPKEYKEEYIKDLYDGLNQDVDPQKIEKDSVFKIPKIHRTENSKTLDEAIAKNEKSNHRCVGLTLETRPDFITEEELIEMRKFGCTRVELGVQSLFDDVQEFTKRGHTREQVAQATKLLRDAGFKISYHLMPGLPGSNLEKDMETVRLTFQDERFKPDLLKLYPCVVVPYSQLEKLWKEGGFKPYNEKDLMPILIQMKKLVPRYCRLTRLVRDIPKESILDGCKIINLRQMIHEEMEKQDIKCQCIRCREIKGEKIDIKNVEMRRENYKASDGDEIFLTFNEIKKDKLISLLRLRIPSQYFSLLGNEIEKSIKSDSKFKISNLKFKNNLKGNNGEIFNGNIENCLKIKNFKLKINHNLNKRVDFNFPHFIPELSGCAIIREVHTYGFHTSVGEKSGNTQHFGFGRKLLAEAERIAKEEYGLNKIAVIAGVGVREYYEKNGYKKEGTYMVKEL